MGRIVVSAFSSTACIRGCRWDFVDLLGFCRLKCNWYNDGFLFFCRVVIEGLSFVIVSAFWKLLFLCHVTCCSRLFPFSFLCYHDSCNRFVLSSCFYMKELGIKDGSTVEWLSSYRWCEAARWSIAEGWGNILRARLSLLKFERCKVVSKGVFAFSKQLEDNRQKIVF